MRMEFNRAVALSILIQLSACWRSLATEILRQSPPQSHSDKVHGASNFLGKSKIDSKLLIGRWRVSSRFPFNSAESSSRDAIRNESRLEPVWIMNSSKLFTKRYTLVRRKAIAVDTISNLLGFTCCGTWWRWIRWCAIAESRTDDVEHQNLHSKVLRDDFSEFLLRSNWLQNNKILMDGLENQILTRALLHMSRASMEWKVLFVPVRDHRGVISLRKLDVVVYWKMRMGRDWLGSGRNRFETWLKLHELDRSPYHRSHATEFAMVRRILLSSHLATVYAINRHRCELLRCSTDKRTKAGRSRSNFLCKFPTASLKSKWTNANCFHRVAGTAGAVITCPLEVVKTRLQSSNAFLPVHAARISELPGIQNPTSDALRRPEQRRKFSSTILRRVRPQVNYLELYTTHQLTRFRHRRPLFCSLFRSRSHRRKRCANISSIKSNSKWM